MKHLIFSKHIVSFILSLSLVSAGVPSELMGRSFLAPPGVKEAQQKMGRAMAEHNKPKTVREKLLSSESLIQSIVAIEQMIELYVTVQEQKSKAIKFLFSKINHQKIAQKIGNIILVLEPDEQEIILAVLEQKIRLRMQNPEYENDLTYLVMVHVYHQVKNFPRRRQVVKAASSTAAPMPTGSLGDIQKVVTMVSRYVPFITTASDLISKTAKKLWAQGEYGPALAWDAQHQARIKYTKGRYAQEPEVMKILLDGQKASDLIRTLKLKQYKGIPADDVLGRGIWGDYQKNQDNIQWGMHRKTFQSDVKRRIASFEYKDDPSAEVHWRNFMFSCIWMHQLKGLYSGTNNEQSVLEWDGKIESAYELLEKAGTPVTREITEQQKTVMHLEAGAEIILSRAKRESKKTEDRKPSWWDTLTYEKAIDELLHADEYSFEFWRALVDRMELKFEKQALQAIQKAQ